MPGAIKQRRRLKSCLIEVSYLTQQTLGRLGFRSHWKRNGWRQPEKSKPLVEVCYHDPTSCEAMYPMAKSVTSEVH
jgi:hypothetical protein